MTRHDDQRLSDKVEEHTPEEGHQEDQPCVDENAKCKDLEEIVLQIKIAERAIDLNVIDDEIYRVAYQRPGQDLKRVGDDDKQSSENQMPLIF